MPTEAVDLPVNGAVLRFRLRGDDAPSDFIAFYDYGIHGERVVRTVRVLTTGVLAPCGTVKRRKRAALARYLARELPGYREASLGREQLRRQLLNILFYLRGSKEIMRRVPSGATDPGQAVGTSGGAHERRPQVLFVGKRITSVVTKRELDQAFRRPEMKKDPLLTAGVGTATSH